MIGAAHLGIIAALRQAGGGSPGGSDPLFANVVLLLHGEGADGSTTFIDSGPDALVAAATGGVAIDTAQFKYGTASIEFTSGSNIYYGFDNKWSIHYGGPKTFECFFRCNAGSLASRNPHLFSVSTGAEFGWAQFRAYIANGQLAFYSDHSGGTNSTTIAAISAEQWYHLAIVSNGSVNDRTLIFFLDGQPVHFARVVGQIGTPRLMLGSREGSTAANNLLGHMDDVRVTHAARYPLPIAVPSAQLGSDANVSLLLLGNGADGAEILDSSGNAHALTTTGTAPTVETDHTPTGTGGCLRFTSGAGYLSTPVDADFEFGTGDWTVEFWSRTDSTDRPSNQRPVLSVSGALDNGHFAICATDGGLWKTPSLRSRYAGNTLVYTTYTGAQLSDLAWHHNVFVRSGNWLCAFVDGQYRNMWRVAADQAFGISGRGWQIGFSTALGAYGSPLFLADLRVTKGVSRYPSTFTPPVAQFPDS